MASTKSTTQLIQIIRQVIQTDGKELDEPSLEYLVSLINEETEFIREAPGCMTEAQFNHLLTTKLEDVLVTYELVTTEEEARKLCTRMIREMCQAKWIELVLDDSSASEESKDGSASGTASEYKPPLLSAPVKILDIARSEEERNSQLEYSMAAIQRAAASSKWSASEELILFQSLADTPERFLEDDEDEDSLVEGGCAMCQRIMPLTRHHLVPKMHHSHPHLINAIYRDSTKEFLNNHITAICRPCHSALHSTYDEKTLAQSYHTIDLILGDEQLKRWIAYISKKRVNRTVAQTKSGAKLHYSK